LLAVLPEFMGEWGAGEWSLLVAVFALLGIDGAKGWTMLRWIGRGFKAGPIAPQPVTVVPETPKLQANVELQDGPRAFVGREDALAELKGMLKAEANVAITSKAVVHGSGGLGKTTLAREFMRRSKARYDITLWVEANTRANATNAILADGCLALGLEIPAQQSPEVARQVMTTLAASGRTALVVFDNVDDYAEVERLIPQGDKIDLIITTRTAGGYPGYQQLPLGVLGYDTVEGEAVTLVMQEAATDQDAEGARDLAQALGGLPLALVTAGRLIREEGGSFADYQSRLEDILLDAPPQGNRRVGARQDPHRTSLAAIGQAVTRYKIGAGI